MYKKTEELNKECEELRQNEQRFHDFVECAADWYWETDERLRITFVSDDYHSLLGRSLYEITSRPTAGLHIDWGQEREAWNRYDKLIQARRPFQDYKVDWKHLVGGNRTITLSGKPYFGHDGAFIGFRGVTRDVTDASRMAQEMAHLATHDPLTGLVNRTEFERRVNRALESNRKNRSLYTLCYLDLDQFKIINDTCGHVAGDELLIQIGQVLNSKIRARDTLARLGGDEFGLLLENCPLSKAAQIAESLAESLRNYRFVWEQRTFEIQVSIGVVALSPKIESVNQFLTQADAACYTAKNLGRNKVYIDRSNVGVTDKHSETYRAADLINTLKNDRLTLYVQPIIPLEAKPAPMHYEVFVRMLDDNDEIISPSAFIPAAERYGIMPSIDRWVIENAFQRFSVLSLQKDKTTLAINLSGTSLTDKAMLSFIERQFSESRIPADQICFEITETAPITDFTQAAHFVTEIKKRGCKFSLDDFGCGVNSFTYLKNLPIDYLKIDGSFIKDITKGSTDRAMVAAINEIGRVMGMKTIAEWVDSVEIFDTLKKMKVDYVQGYELGRPRPIDSLR